MSAVLNGDGWDCTEKNYFCLIPQRAMPLRMRKVSSYWTSAILELKIHFFHITIKRNSLKNFFEITLCPIKNQYFSLLFKSCINFCLQHIEWALVGFHWINHDHPLKKCYCLKLNTPFLKIHSYQRLWLTLALSFDVWCTIFVVSL